MAIRSLQLPSGKMRYVGLGWAPNPYDWYLYKVRNLDPDRYMGRMPYEMKMAVSKPRTEAWNRSFLHSLEGFKPGLASDWLTK